MSVSAAYLIIVLIWSTTPLAIQWSAQDAGFSLAVFARMAIGLAGATLLLAAWRINIPTHHRARKAYLVGGLSLFGAMALTYWGARYIHSGLISVLFGLAPLMTSALARIQGLEGPLRARQWIGMLLGSIGLGVIFLHGQLLAGKNAAIGLVAVLAAVLIYASGLVGMKRIGDDSPPLATTVGSLGVSLPLFAVLWWFADGQSPTHIGPRSLAAIAYLGIFGSVIGFALYYFVIQHLDASRIALITLITPVMALVLGSTLNGEAISVRLALGSACILGGLMLHQGPMLWHSLRGMIQRREAL